MSLRDDRWLLPEGVEEALPPLAARLESGRRRLLDLFASWGYELVVPPFVEHMESLLTGAGSDLEQQTFKLVDPSSGRLLGVRADMTPQVARIDARHMDRGVPARLCYLGTVLRARADGLAGSRSPVQVGAELYGHGGIESDCEVLSLMLATLDALAVTDVHLDLGHVGVFRALGRAAGLEQRDESVLLEVMQRKAPDELEAALAAVPGGSARDALRMLIELNGGEEVIAAARAALAGAGPAVTRALDDLERLVESLRLRGVGVPLHFDLSELRGYRYHTGMMFAAFVPGVGHEVARGGRYDDIGRVFGASRPATGFSTDLKLLMSLSEPAAGTEGAPAIAAPWDSDPTLLARVAELRAAGERVVYVLPGSAGVAPACDRRLARVQGAWSVVGVERGARSE